MNVYSSTKLQGTENLPKRTLRSSDFCIPENQLFLDIVWVFHKRNLPVRYISRLQQQTVMYTSCTCTIKRESTKYKSLCNFFIMLLCIQKLQMLHNKVQAEVNSCTCKLTRGPKLQGLQSLTAPALTKMSFGAPKIQFSPALNLLFSLASF